MEITHSNFIDYIRDMRRAKWNEGIKDFDLFLTPQEFQVGVDVCNAILYPVYLPIETKSFRFMGVTISEATPLPL